MDPIAGRPAGAGCDSSLAFLRKGREESGSAYRKNLGKLDGPM